MKRFVIWSAAALLLLAGGIAVVRTEGLRRHGWRGGGWHHRGPLGYVARELDLNTAQRSQVQSIWQAERPAVSSLIREFDSESSEMIAATKQGNFDEARVQEIAGREGATVSKFLVEKEKLTSKIYATVLNPGQRTKADELRKKWHSHLEKFAARMDVGETGRN